MTSYAVLAPPLPAEDGAPEALRLVFVKDGFCWPAMTLTLPWMLVRGLFVEAAAYVVVVAGLGALVAHGGAPVVALLAMVPIALGFLGNDLRRFALARRGYRLAGAASGASLDEAEIRYFLGAGMSHAASTGPTPAAPAARIPSPGPAGAVIGLFPQPEAAR